jgi:hypothetical protein
MDVADVVAQLGAGDLGLGGDWEGEGSGGNCDCSQDWCLHDLLLIRIEAGRIADGIAS